MPRKHTAQLLHLHPCVSNHASLAGSRRLWLSPSQQHLYLAHLHPQLLHPQLAIPANQVSQEK